MSYGEDIMGRRDQGSTQSNSLVGFANAFVPDEAPIDNFSLRRHSFFIAKWGETPGFGIRGAGPLVPIRKKGTRKRERMEKPTLSPQEHHGQPSEAQDRETFGIFLGVVLKGQSH